MRCIALIVVVGALGLLAAGCGGGGKAPGVANLADSSTTGGTTTTQSGSSSGGKPFGPPGGGHGQFSLSMRTGNAADGEKFSACMRKHGLPTPAQIAQQQQKLLAFSACMRAHGLKDFPDPSNGGLRISVHPGSDLEPNNPTFQKAQQACQKYMPFKGGGADDPCAQ